MINPQNGTMDRAAIRATARSRAIREWGAPNPPPLYLREAYRWAMERAEGMARGWRRERGLPVEVAVTWVHVAEWGASGDSFSR